MSGRILHVADVHAGITPVQDRRDPTTGLPSRTLDVARAWRHVTDIAVDRAVDAVILAGDTFDVKDPSAPAVAMFAESLRRLDGIPVLIIAGNHDAARHPAQPSIVEAFAEPPHVHVVSRIRRFEDLIVDLDGIKVACMPWASTAALQAMNPGLTREAGAQAVVDELVRVLASLRTEGADVLTLHWTIEGSVFANGQPATIGDDPTIPLAELEGDWYVAAGHIHARQEFRVGSTRGAYPGSLQRLNQGEAGEPKGVLEVDLSTGETTFHEVPVREFVTVTPDDVREVGVDVEGAVVRLRLTGTREELAAIDKGALQRQLYAAGAHLVTLDVETEREISARAREVTEASEPLDALDAWLRVNDVGEADAARLRELAKGLAEEVGA